ncbi:MAG: isoaspartyl peptidase/L-asparaginase [Anaerolineaceae bacterium]|nr:isoaspartyl peptidase/L-asparaginase [Anaerolineaceae bacterium]
MLLVAADFKNSGTAITWSLMRQGQSALAAVEQGIRAVERNTEDETVGRGGFPNALGQMELDAGVMDGRTRASGAVGALQGFLHPVSMAYAVMTRLPHVLLVGEGAARFAAEIGAERGENLTEAMHDNWLAWCQEHGFDPHNPNQSLMETVFRQETKTSGGTTVYLALDAQGDMVAATSTSGWSWKYPGRLGDSPIAGAGFYADNRYGAAACTGVGEIAIRSSMARMVVAYMQMGRTVVEAVPEAMSDIHYHGDQTSGITVYAISASGDHFVGSNYAQGSPHPYYYMASGDDETPVKRDTVDLRAI